jgi:enamine deaminase RidA (YjgF/YER057c/UK114 family)
MRLPDAASREAPFCGRPRPGVYGAVIERRAIEPDAWGADLEWYRETRLSPAVQVGDLLFVAGCTGATAAEDGPRAQMRRAYEEIEQVLHAAGASWDDVVSMTTYHVHFRRDIEAMTEIHREFVTKEPFPAWTAVGVTASTSRWRSSKSPSTRSCHEASSVTDCPRATSLGGA